MKKIAFVITALSLLAFACTSEADEKAEEDTTTSLTTEQPADEGAKEQNPSEELPASTTTEEETPATTAAVVSTAGGTFESPTGNILCSMLDDYVDCYILEKNWEIKDADIPEECEFDYGNGLSIGLGETEPGFDCYSDAYFEGYRGTVLEYGTAMKSEAFTCTSSETGVRCEDEFGIGITMAKDTYPLG